MATPEIARRTALERERFWAPSGHVVAELAIDGLRFFFVDENPDAFNLSPSSLDGTGLIRSGA